MMNAHVDYRSPAHRQEGFDWFYKAMCQSGDVSPEVLCERWVADSLDYNFEKRCVLALHQGSTHSGPCEALFAEHFPLMTADVRGIESFFRKNQQRLSFANDARYRKIYFPEFLASVGKTLKRFGTLGNLITSCIQSDDGKKNYLSLRTLCESEWFQWGRMAHWCFAEALVRILDLPIDPPSMEFGKEGRSHTDGWAFSIGRDDLLDKKWTREDLLYFENSARTYIEQFRSMHPELKTADFFTLVTACCNYKRGHRGTRYQLCYIDEQYADLVLAIDEWPEKAALLQKYLEARQAILPASLLYENHRQSPGNDSSTAYLRTWQKSLAAHGRMPRVEAYINDKPQRWFEPFDV